MRHYQAVIIGGGCAGLACAASLKKNGIEDIVLLEKDDEVGGILNQCIHNGFGLTTFKEQLAGPAFAERFAREARELGVEIKTGTMVVEMNPDKTISYENKEEGYVTISSDTVILSVGCYERNRGAVQIDGIRCSGVYTAGQAQRYLNIDGYMVGKKVFILGSGDIGLIMARRMHLEGAEVLGVAEIMPYSNGLPRNIKQCLEDYNIPLYLSHTVTKVYGKGRLSAIDVCRVENMKPVYEDCMHIECDTLLLSVGLIPENHLAEKCGIQMDPRIKGPVVDENFMTSVEGIFACGNGLHVHDLADYAAQQGKKAGEGAARYIQKKESNLSTIKTLPGDEVGYVVPGILHPTALPNIVEVYFRCRKPLKEGTITIRQGDRVIREIKKTNLMPSEMEIIPIASKMIQDTDDLTVEIRGAIYA